MTLIVGIKCSDGIVVGADGAATLSSFDLPTARQSVKKLMILDNSVIIGVSGPIGLGQRIQGEISGLWFNRKLSGKQTFQAMTLIREAIWPHISNELDVASKAQKAIGQKALHSALSTTMVAMPISKSPSLFQFDQQGAPEEATDDLPFASIGGGQYVADPFLSFIRRIFWGGKTPNLGRGIFYVVWTLRHAIETMPGGVAYPIQLATLEKKEGKWVAREFAQEELQEHHKAVTEFKDTLRQARDDFFSPDKTLTEGIPPPPKT